MRRVNATTKMRRWAATEEEVDATLRDRISKALAKVKQCYTGDQPKNVKEALALVEKALKKQTSDQGTIDAMREIHDSFVGFNNQEVKPLVGLADAVGYWLEGSGEANKSLEDWAKVVAQLATAAETAAINYLSEKKKEGSTMMRSSRFRRRHALMNRRLPPATPRMPGRRFKSVDPVELEYDAPDPLESLELEEGMEDTPLLRRLPPRAPALPSRKVRLRKLSSARRAALLRRRFAFDGRQQILPEVYEEVIDNTKQGPGKFEGEGAVGEWVYDKAGEGWGEMLGDAETFGHYTLLTFEKPVLVRESDYDGYDWIFSSVIIHEDSQGFVNPTYYETVEEGEAAWASLEEEYGEWLDETGDEDYDAAELREYGRNRWS